MARTVSVDGVPKRVLQYLVGGIAVFLALWGVFSLYSAAVGGFDVFGRPWILGTLAAAWAALTALWVRRARRWDAGGSFWDAVPREQYAGRLAEAGGLARDSWERALPDDGRDEE
jgi:hypothetical protein